jgi:hypothetical protein
MKKTVISAFITASFGLCAMEGLDFEKIAEDLQKKIEERLAQGEIKKHTLVPNGSSSSFSNSFSMMRDNVPLDREDEAKCLDSLKNKKASIAIKMNDSDIDNYFTSAAKEIKKRLANGDTKKNTAQERNYKNLLEKGIDDFFKKKETHPSDYFKMSSRIIFTNQDQKPFCIVSMNNANNGFVINTNAQTLKTSMENVDKVALDKAIVQSAQPLTSKDKDKDNETQLKQNKIKANDFVFNLLNIGLLSENEKVIVEKLPSLFIPGKVPYVTIVEDSAIEKHFGVEAARAFEDRLAQGVDGEQAKKLAISHWPSLQKGAAKIFKNNNATIEDFFAKNEFAAFSNSQNLPLFAIYRSNSRKAPSRKLASGDLTINVDASLIAAGLKLRNRIVGVQELVVQTSTQQDGKSPKSEQ